MPERILITGGAGFIGRSLARRCLAAGHDVRVLDTLSAQVHGPDRARSGEAGLPGAVEFVHGSVLSAADLRRALAGVSIVIHLAAETGTGQSMYEVERYVETNARGTALLLDQLAGVGMEVRRLVVASSRAVYGEGAYSTADGRTVHPLARDALDLSAGDFDVHVPGEGALTPVPTAESAPAQPTSVYGITKHVQESLVMTVAPTLGIVPVALRFQNVYGPGQSLANPYTGILSIFAGLIRRGREVNIFEDGEESRDFVFVDDVAEAAFRCAVHPDASGVYNVGSGVATTVLEVARTLSEALHTPADLRISGQFRLGDIRHNVADLTRIRSLGWSPRVPFDDGVAAFADWAFGQPASEGSDAGYARSLGELTSRGLLR